MGINNSKRDPEEVGFNLSAWGYLIPSPYCYVGRFFCRIFKF
jgi:hypothetical protein